MAEMHLGQQAGRVSGEPQARPGGWVERGWRVVSGELWAGGVLLLRPGKSSLREPPPAVPGSRVLLPLSTPTCLLEDSLVPFSCFPALVPTAVPRSQKGDGGGCECVSLCGRNSLGMGRSLGQGRLPGI